jgi:hypothetical protein
MSEDNLDEARKKVRVSSTGEKTKKVRCKPGYKVSSSGNSCVPMTSKEKVTRRKAAKKSVRKRKGKSQAATKRKRIKALKKRKTLGVS